MFFSKPYPLVVPARPPAGGGLSPEEQAARARLEHLKNAIVSLEAEFDETQADVCALTEKRGSLTRQQEKLDKRGTKIEKMRNKIANDMVKRELYDKTLKENGFLKIQLADAMNKNNDLEIENDSLKRRLAAAEAPVAPAPPAAGHVNTALPVFAEAEFGRFSVEMHELFKKVDALASLPIGDDDANDELEVIRVAMNTRIIAFVQKQFDDFVSGKGLVDAKVTLNVSTKKKWDGKYQDSFKVFFDLLDNELGTSSVTYLTARISGSLNLKHVIYTSIFFGDFKCNEIVPKTMKLLSSVTSSMAPLPSETFRTLEKFFPDLCRCKKEVYVRKEYENFKQNFYIDHTISSDEASNCSLGKILGETIENGLVDLLRCVQGMNAAISAFEVTPDDSTDAIAKYSVSYSDLQQVLFTTRTLVLLPMQDDLYELATEDTDFSGLKKEDKYQVSAGGVLTLNEAFKRTLISNKFTWRLHKDLVEKMPLPLIKENPSFRTCVGEMDSA
jgi:regulator of replication initiation timing